MVWPLQAGWAMSLPGHAALHWSGWVCCQLQQQSLPALGLKLPVVNVQLTSQGAVAGWQVGYLLVMLPPMAPAPKMIYWEKLR